MPEIIRCDSVSFQYSEDAPFVIDGVSLPVQRGEFVAVLGANGCGKSTLAKLFNAILLPQKGTVWVEGISTADEARLYDIRQKVGMVFQNPDNQIVATVVEEDVAFALENLGVPPDEMRSRIDAAMEAAGVYKYRLRQPHKLSGGQKQRVAIAGVLAMNPDCLVLDEATAMLDPRGRERIMQTVRRLNAERGITVVHITHYMEEAAMAGRVLVMDAGRIAMAGTPKEIFSQVEALRALHLDIPQSAELCEALSAAGFAMPRGVLSADECAGLLKQKLGEAGPALPSPPAADISRDGPPRAAAPALESEAHDGCEGEEPTPPDTRRGRPLGRPEPSAFAQSHPSAQSAPPIIRVEHLSYTYNAGLPDATTALNDISFEVPEHSFLGLIGPTGCGKSTLITHFNGLMKPSAGKIYIAGEDLWANPADIRRFRFLCGLVFQYPEYQLFEETVARDIAYGPKNMGLSAAEVDERVRQAARFCGIGEELLSRSPFELSGGQKRRVAIAGVIAMRPRLLVLDEPASGLDPEGRDTILAQIQGYHRQTGTSVVLVSHSMEDVAKYADRVLVMREGGIAMYDDMPAVFARAAQLVELGLSVPQITKIFLKLREEGLGIPTDIYTVKYAAETVLRYAAGKGGDGHAT